MITLTTDRDNHIVKDWFERYHYGSIRQIQQAYFGDQDYGYTIAARRLKELVTAGQLRMHQNEVTGKNIYIYKGNKDLKPPTMSTLFLLDLLAKLKYLNFNVEYYKIEKFWMDGKIRSDAMAIFTGKKNRYYFFIEVQLSKHPHNLEKYDTLFESGEVQKMLGKNYFPKILFISDINYSDAHLKLTEVIQFGTKLNAFPFILL